MTDSGSMTNPSEAMQPDCDICGRPFKAHNMGSGFAMCPVAAVGYRPRQAATPAAPVPKLNRPPYCEPNEFLLLASYCGDDNDACTEARPCVDCLAMCNVFAEDGQYVRELGTTPVSRLTPDRVTPLVEALRKCRHKFLHYEDLHRLKCTAEGDEKADRNRDMADMIDTALRDGGFDA